MLNLNVMAQPVDQTWSIERIGREARPVSWATAFDSAKHELQDVSTILEEQEQKYGMYYPLKKDIFMALHLTPLNSVKVVLVGQDPYPQTILVNGVSVPRGTGNSFSVRREDAIPNSLQNIYTELGNTVKGFVRPDHGDLTEWARQGVLLLNSCLTVRPGSPASHGDIWLGFINKVFQEINRVNPYCIFLLWGREAQKLKPMLGERSVILEAAHPSGLSARRGFFGCNHFNQVNEILIKQGKVGINWRISPLKELRATTNPVNIPTPKPTFQPKLVPIDATLRNQENRSPPELPAILAPPPISTPLPTIPSIIGGNKIPTVLPMHMLPQIIGGPRSELLPIIPNTRDPVPVEPSTSPIGGALLPTLYHMRTANTGVEVENDIRVDSPETIPPGDQPVETNPIPIIPQINFGITHPDPNIIKLDAGGKK